MTRKNHTFPALPEPIPLARFSAAEDLRAAIGLWAAWLAGERRASAHTIVAYGRDLAFFLEFLTEHLGGPPGLAAIGGLRPADFRAYLARRAGEGIDRQSLARALSVLRGFLRFLQRRQLAATTALAALRSPKLPHHVPKPLTVEDAACSLDSAGELAGSRWQRKRDTAIFTLLYGCGLRLSEALGL
ncbi:MAG: site-specific integrase, partial [Candidatus Eremiobacteraeota bacterium]|nr:site-specific integrase [Candidatus Eremiobacteraeota bacterium]